MKSHPLKGIYLDKKGKLYTKNLCPGRTVYGELLVQYEGVEYRQWDIRRSKLAAALQKKISQIGMKPGDHVLYLGASSGTTPSHVSDIVGEEGMVYALDFAPRMTRDLTFLSKIRSNMAPILADAFKTTSFMDKITQVDCIFQDIAQKNQVEIFLRNIDYFLKPQGFGFISLKARSIDVTRKPKEIFREVRAALEKRHAIVDYRELDPYEKDHAVFVIKKRL